MKKIVIALSLVLASCSSPAVIIKQGGKTPELVSVELKNMACTYLGAGMDAYKEGQYDLAFRLFSKVANDYYRGAEPNCLGQAYYYLGKIYLRRGSTSAAMPLFEEANKVGAKHDNAYTSLANEELGKMYFNKNLLWKAKQHFIEMMKKNAGYADGYALLCKTEFLLGEITDAQADCSRALLLDSHNAEATKLMNSLQELNRQKEKEKPKGKYLLLDGRT